MSKVRVLGLDVGDVRIGVALSDPTLTLASPFKILNSIGAEEEIEKICKEYGIQVVVYGLPISLDGTEKRQAEKVKEFISNLSQKLPLEYISSDERFSTMIISKSMMFGKRDNMQKKRIDDLSATVILQSYLDNLKRKF